MDTQLTGKIKINRINKSFGVSYVFKIKGPSTLVLSIHVHVFTHRTFVLQFPINVMTQFALCDTYLTDNELTSQL
jgi:hypothetical protein